MQNTTGVTVEQRSRFSSCVENGHTLCILTTIKLGPPWLTCKSSQGAGKDRKSAVWISRSRYSFIRLTCISARSLVRLVHFRTTFQTIIILFKQNRQLTLSIHSETLFRQAERVRIVMGSQYRRWPMNCVHGNVFTSQWQLRFIKWWFETPGPWTHWVPLNIGPHAL